MVLAKQRFDVTWNRYNFPFSMEGCELYLPLWQDDMQGTTIYSYDKNRHVGTVTGFPWSSQGRTGDGDDVISIPASNSLSPTNGSGVDQPFGIMAWIKPTDATNFIICSRGSSTTREYSFFINNLDKLAVSLSDPASTKAIGMASDAALTAYEGSFVHVAALYTGSELNTGLSLLVNGVTVAATGSTTGVYAGCTRSADNFQIGKLWSNGTVFGIGTYRDFAMYVNRLPTVAEVINHMNSTRRDS